MSDVDVIAQWNETAKALSTAHSRDMTWHRAGDAIARELEKCRAERDAMREKIRRVDALRDRWLDKDCEWYRSEIYAYELEKALADSDGDSAK